MRGAGERQDERAVLNRPVVDGNAVDRHRHQRLPAAVEPQRADVRILSLDMQRRVDAGARGIEIEIERDVGHEPVRRGVVLTARDVWPEGVGEVVSTMSPSHFHE